MMKHGGRRNGSGRKRKPFKKEEEIKWQKEKRKIYNARLYKKSKLAKEFVTLRQSLVEPPQDKVMTTPLTKICFAKLN